MRRRDWEGACARWAEFRHAFPDQAAGFVRGAVALMNAGHLEEAEAVAGEAAEHFPTRPVDMSSAARSRCAGVTGRAPAR